MSSGMARYGGAVTAVGAALLVGLWLRELFDAQVVFLLAVAIVGWFGGMWPAFVTALLATPTFAYFFLDPIYAFNIDVTHLPRLIGFMAIAFVLAGMSAGRRRVEQTLHSASVRQADLLNLTHDTVFVRDMNDVIQYWNRGAEELYGWSTAEAVGRVTHELMQTEFPEPLQRINDTLLRDGRWEGELVHTTRAGTRVVVASRWSLQRGPDGKPVAILETNNDVTNRRSAEDALRQSERRYRHIFDATAASIWEEDFSRVKAAIDDLKQHGVTDFREYVRQHPEFVERAISLVRIVDVNEATLKLFAARSKQDLLESLHKVFTPETREVFVGELVAIAEQRPLFEGETVLQKLTGERVAAIFSVSFPPPDASFDAVMVSIMDITDRKRAEQELEELAGRLIHAQEEERRRIGRELHDHISQMLGVLTIRLDQLRASESTSPRIAATLQQLREQAADITQDIHNLSHRLHSSALDYLGLVPAVQKLVHESAARHKVAVTFEHGSLPPLPSDVALCLFRVVEEGLSNIAKHSRAGSARVFLTTETDGLHLTIQDDGAGFDADRAGSKAGLGFVSMRERLRLVRGTLRISSAHGHGTTVDVFVPESRLQEAASAEALGSP